MTCHEHNTAEQTLHCSLPFPPPVRQIHSIHWPEGRTRHCESGSYRGDFLLGKLTGFVPNMRLEVCLDDSSVEFNHEYEALFA